MASQPAKTTYYVGDTLDTTGLTLLVTYSNGSSEIITNGFTCSPTELNTAGTQIITVTFEGLSTTFAVVVEEIDLDSVLMGDVNGDGTINYLDAMLIAQYYVGMIADEDLNLSAADVNGDGTVNYLDAMMVAQFYVGMIDSFPAEN